MPVVCTLITCGVRTVPANGRPRPGPVYSGIASAAAYLADFPTRHPASSMSHIVLRESSDHE